MQIKRVKRGDFDLYHSLLAGNKDAAMYLITLSHIN